MSDKDKKPVATSIYIALACIVIGIWVLLEVSTVSGVLMLVLGVLILGMNIWLMQCSIIFLGYNKNRGKDIGVYKEFASFYLRDRQLAYSKETFKRAINNNWHDIATMCILLGIKNKLTIEEAEAAVTKSLENDNVKLFQVLLRGKFNGDYIPYENGAPLLFLTLDKENPRFLECLLKSKVSPDSVDLTGTKPIFKVIKDNRQDLAKLLIQHGADLSAENLQGLTPLFSAVAEENIDICQAILERLPETEVIQPVQFNEGKHRVMLGEQHKKYTERKILVKMIASGDKSTLQILKSYFKDKMEYNLSIEAGVEVYTRLSYLGGNYEKHTSITKEKQTVYPETECVKDLLKRVVSRYKMAPIGSFKIQNIYPVPKCIESVSVACKKCEGSGKIVCNECGGHGTVKCPTCGGTGIEQCPKCEGTQKISCEVLKEYIECNNCKNQQYICDNCSGRGIEVCPTCGGNGGKKCKCPENKKIPCQHCDNGYIEIKKGEYRKCKHCKGTGTVCVLCNNTGWIKFNSGNRKDACEKCNGSGRIKCHVCKGKKRLKCTKAYAKPCDCDKGVISCTQCGGTKTKKCERCGGTGKEQCLDCLDGNVYENIYLDFNCENMLNKEAVLSKNEEPYLEDFKENGIASILKNEGYANTIYTYKRLQIEPKDLTITDYQLDQQMQSFLTTKEEKGIIEILEVVPLYYQMVTVKKSGEEVYRGFIINNKFFKSY